MNLSNFAIHPTWNGFLLFSLFTCMLVPQKWKKQSFTHRHAHAHTCTRTQIWCPFSCIVVSYISEYLEVNLPRGKTIKASQQWAISPCLVDHFPSNIHSASSSKADQCCENRNPSCSSWKQWRKRRRLMSTICDTRDSFAFVLITSKLAIGSSPELALWFMWTPNVMKAHICLLSLSCQSPGH